MLQNKGQEVGECRVIYFLLRSFKLVRVKKNSKSDFCFWKKDKSSPSETHIACSSCTRWRSKVSVLLKDTLSAVVLVPAGVIYMYISVPQFNPQGLLLFGGFYLIRAITCKNHVIPSMKHQNVEMNLQLHLNTFS